MGIMALAAIAIQYRLMNAHGLIIDGLVAGGTKGIRFCGWQQRPALTGTMAGGTFATGHGPMNFYF